jgi:hypothetical protein
MTRDPPIVWLLNWTVIFLVNHLLFFIMAMLIIDRSAESVACFAIPIVMSWLTGLVAGFLVIPFRKWVEHGTRWLAWTQIFPCLQIAIVMVASDLTWRVIKLTKWDIAEWGNSVEFFLTNVLIGQLNLLVLIGVGLLKLVHDREDRMIHRDTRPCHPFVHVTPVCDSSYHFWPLARLAYQTNHCIRSAQRAFEDAEREAKKDFDAIWQENLVTVHRELYTTVKELANEKSLDVVHGFPIGITPEQITDHERSIIEWNLRSPNVNILCLANGVEGEAKYAGTIINTD